MTQDRRPGEPGDPADEGTRVVERETYVERPVNAYAPPPASSNVNVGGGGQGVATASPGPLHYAARVVSLVFGVLAVLIGLRILLLLLVANAGNSIVDFVYSITQPFVEPFRGIFAFDVVRSGDAALDIGAVVALIGWLLIYLLIMAILRLGDRNTSATV